MRVSKKTAAEFPCRHFSFTPYLSVVWPVDSVYLAN